MKLKRYKLFSAGVIFLIIVNLHLLDFGDVQTAFRSITSVLSAMMGFICILEKDIYKKISPYCKFYNKWLITVYAFIVVETINGSLFGPYHLVTYIGYDHIFLWLLLYYPIVYIGICENGLGELIKWICTFTIITLVVKTSVWWLYNYRGRDVMHYLLYEFGEEWIRRGNQRIPSTCFSGVLCAAMFQLLMTSKKQVDKILSFLVIAFSLWYSWEIFSSRSQLISYIISIAAALAFGQKNSLKRILIYIMLVIAAVEAIEILAVQEFIDGLSIQTYSIGTRFRAIEYFFHIWFRKPFLGCLYTMRSEAIRGSAGNFYLSDVGLLELLIGYGIIGAAIFMIPLLRIVSIAFKNINGKNENGYFLIFLMVYTLVFSTLSNSIYNYRYFFGMAFILAIYEFEKQKRGGFIKQRNAEGLS